MKHVKLSTLSLIYSILSAALIALTFVISDDFMVTVMQKLAIALAVITTLFLCYLVKDGDKTMEEMDKLHVSNVMFENGLRSEIWAFRIPIVVCTTLFLFADMVVIR